jgi:hypothetical protein
VDNGLGRAGLGKKYHPFQSVVVIMKSNQILFKSSVFMDSVCVDGWFNGSVNWVLNKRMKNYLKNKSIVWCEEISSASETINAW